MLPGYGTERGVVLDRFFDAATLDWTGPSRSRLTTVSCPQAARQPGRGLWRKPRKGSRKHRTMNNEREFLPCCFLGGNDRSGQDLARNLASPKVQQERSPRVVLLRAKVPITGSSAPARIPSMQLLPDVIISCAR